ncbi:MAG: hypothetical protein AAGC67_05140 [Myxococcota bacterium]
MLRSIKLALLLLPLMLLPRIGEAQLILDLADIVGGGDGTGTGGFQQGIETSTGLPTTFVENINNAPVNTFVTSINPFVDGLVIPDGGPGRTASIPISSTGLVVTGVTDMTPLVSPGTITPTTLSVWNGTFCTVFCTVGLPGIQIQSFANHGITFDLDAIEAFHSDEAIAFSVSAVNGQPGALGSPLQLGSHYVFVDGQLEAEVDTRLGTNVVTFPPILLEPSDRFLTLMTSANGTINGDFEIWLDPVLLLPEPGFGAGLVCCTGLLQIIGSRRVFATTDM